MMKLIRSTLLVAATSLSLLNLGNAQPTATAPPADDLQILIQAVEATPPLPASIAPKAGNFYSAQHGLSWPPMPANAMNLPFWNLGNGFLLLDDLSVDYAALQA